MKYWTNRHKAKLYNHFDRIRYKNIVIEELDFFRDMLDQKVTDRVLLEIEREYDSYWIDCHDYEKPEDESLYIHKIYNNKALLLPTTVAVEIAKAVIVKFKNLESVQEIIAEMHSELSD